MVGCYWLLGSRFSVLGSRSSVQVSGFWLFSFFIPHSSLIMSSFRDFIDLSLILPCKNQNSKIVDQYSIFNQKSILSKPPRNIVLRLLLIRGCKYFSCFAELNKLADVKEGSIITHPGSLLHVVRNDNNCIVFL
jgi:hypothetical protein